MQTPRVESGGGNGPLLGTGLQRLTTAVARDLAVPLGAGQEGERQREPPQRRRHEERQGDGGESRGRQHGGTEGGEADVGGQRTDHGETPWSVEDLEVLRIVERVA